MLYFKEKYYFSAVMLGLSTLSKKWAVYFVISLLLLHIFTHRKEIKKLTRKKVMKILAFLLS